jgi:hypothetical protein
MTGIEYLEKHMNPQHPPVLMLTSVNREDNELALKALKLGAADFVEKPALGKLEESTEEIHLKLKTIAKLAGKSQVKDLSLDESFATPEPKAASKLSPIVFVCSQKDLYSVKGTLSEIGAMASPKVIAVDSSHASDLGKFLEAAKSIGTAHSTATTVLKERETVVIPVRDLQRVLSANQFEWQCVLAFRGVNQSVLDNVLRATNGSIVVEENTGLKTDAHQSRVMDVVAATSFGFLARRAVVGRSKKP